MSVTTTAPNKLSPSTPLGTNLSLLNDNFYNLVFDSSNIGLRAFGVSGLNTTSLLANQLGYSYVDFIDLPASSDYVTLTPQVLIWVDTIDEGHIWPNGISLTTGQQKIAASFTLTITPSNTTYPDFTPFTKSLATLGVNFYNFDSSPHTIYWEATGQVFNKPLGGVFR